MSRSLAVLGVSGVFSVLAVVSCGSPVRDLDSGPGTSGSAGTTNSQAGGAGTGGHSGARAAGGAGGATALGGAGQSIGGDNAKAGAAGIGNEAGIGGEGGIGGEAGVATTAGGEAGRGVAGGGASGGGAGGAVVAGGGSINVAGGGGSGGGGSGGAASCNTVVEQGQPINTQSFPGSPLPKGTHGTIAPGIYVLTNDDWFMNTVSISLAATISVTVQGSVATFQGVFDGVGETARYTGTLSTSDPVTSIYTCEDPVGAFGLLPTPNMPSSSDYTATSNTLILMFPDTQGQGGGYRLTFAKK